MQLAKKIINRVVPPFCKLVLSSAKYDDIFTAKFLELVDLNMLSLKKTLRSFSLGFLPFEYIWYDLDHNDYRGYIPARSNYQKRRINGEYNAILGNKILFERHIKQVISGIDGMSVADSLGYFENGYLHSFNDNIISGDINSLLGQLNDSDLILKLITGDGGDGFICLSKKDDAFFINSQLLSPEELKAKLNGLDKYLIQRRIKQEGLAGTIFPGSVNTMRIGTMIDPDSHEPFIAFAVHRFGSSSSGIVDNVNQGGITANIDLITGRLSKAHHYLLNGHMEIFERHPVTSEMICNQEIHNWKDVKRRIMEMAGAMPYLKYVGWDFVLSGNELIVLEGNVSPGLGMAQLYGPIRDNKQAWKFFSHYGFVE